MTAMYEAEQANLEKTIKLLKDEIAEVKDEGNKVDSFMKLVHKYSDITELNAEILHSFIEKIIVYEAEEVDGEKRQKIKIIYNCVGAVHIEKPLNIPVKTKIVEVA